MRKEASILFIFILLIGFVLALDFVPREILVEYNNSVISTASASEIKVLDVSGNFLRLQVGENDDIEKLVEELNEYDNVVYAEPNYIYHTFEYPNDVYYSNSLNRQWSLFDINASEAWDITKGSEDVIIAIIDTGVDLDHQDLVNKLWNDSNGYYGYDFVNSDNVPNDDEGHGTHCAGIAAAETNNSIGIAGVCPNCKIMVVKALDENGDTTGYRAAQAVNYSREHNATIISMSFGGSGSSIYLQNALQLAYNDGIILVAAAGNDNTSTIQYPAGYSTVISIGATNYSDEKANYSNYGSWVDLVAPGSYILSTYYNETFQDKYAYGSGTSMAAPLVAGAIGLLKSFDENLVQSDILDLLNSSGNFMDFQGFNFSKINIFSALNEIYLLVNQTSPVDGSYTNIANTNFSCVANSSVYNLTNMTFYFYNSTGDLVYNVTNDILGKDNISIANYTFSTEDTYNWYCKVYNNNSVSATSENRTIIYDSTFPLVNVSNETFFLEINLSYISSEPINYTLNYSGNIDNSSSYSNSSVIELSGLNSSTEYIMNFTFCDRAGNCNFTEFNLTTLSIFVNLISPSNISYTNINETNFTCEINSTESSNLTNVTLFVYNLTGDLIYNSTKLLNGTYNSSTFNYTLEDESNYSWTCEAFNNLSESYSSSNYTLIYDATKPAVSITNPTISTDILIVSSNEAVNYSLSGSKINSSSNYSSSYSIPYDVSCGTSYSFTLVCCDRAGNCNTTLQSFTTSACPVINTNPGGGSGSTPTILGTFSNPALLDDATPTFENEYSVNEVSYFKLNEEKHSVTLSQIVNKIAIIIIKSEPVYVYLSENSSTMVDIDGIKGYDLEVTAGVVTNSSAEIIIKKLIETTTSNVGDTEINNSTGAEPNIESDKTSQSVCWIIGVFVLAGLIYLVFHNRVKLHFHELRLNKLHTASE